MYPAKQFADQFFLDKVRMARMMEPGEKLLAGPRLFDNACDRMESKLRHYFPQASDAEIRDLLFELLRLMRRQGWL
jgi:hypothetical protein